MKLPLREKFDRLQVMAIAGFGLFLVNGLLSGLSGCSSLPPVKQQAYAKLNNERTFEYDFPTVWKGIEETLRNHKIKDRDPEEVDPQEMRKLTRRTLETDWIYGRSQDKHQEYQVNGSPRKTYLQTRYKYLLDAQSVMGGIKLTVRTEEEVERLKEDGQPDGYSAAESDPSRARELLDKIQISIHSAAI